MIYETPYLYPIRSALSSRLRSRMSVLPKQQCVVCLTRFERVTSPLRPTTAQQRLGQHSWSSRKADVMKV